MRLKAIDAAANQQCPAAAAIAWAPDFRTPTALVDQARGLSCAIYSCSSTFSSELPCLQGGSVQQSWLHRQCQSGDVDSPDVFFARVQARHENEAADKGFLPEDQMSFGQKEAFYRQRHLRRQRDKTLAQG